MTAALRPLRDNLKYREREKKVKEVEINRQGKEG